jgi:ketosteroid isomerase-like protein
VVGRFLLVALLAVSLGSVRGQSVLPKHILKYPIPGADDGAIAEVDTKLQQNMLDDFIRSKALIQYDEALKTNDRAAFDSLISDRVVWVAERFGKGEVLSKTQVLASFGSSKVVKVKAHTRDHVHLSVFGDAVILSGRSTSVLYYKGKLSNGARLFTNIWVKEDGRWQLVCHHISDIAQP